MYPPGVLPLSCLHAYYALILARCQEDFAKYFLTKT
nr:MAG TPA: hypothetical protein [Caudoviricetes sp.]